MDELVLAAPAASRTRPSGADGADPPAGTSSGWSCPRGGTTRSTRTCAVRPTQRSFVPETDAFLECEQRRSAGGASRLAGRRPAGARPACRAAARTRPRTPGRSELVRSSSQRRLELRLGLAAEADDHVGRERDARDAPRGSAQGARGRLDGVLAAHPAEHRVVARLDRQVEVLADRVARRHRGDQPIRQVPRVRRHEPQARDAGRRRRARRRSRAAAPPCRAGRRVEAAPAPALRGDVREAGLGRQVVAVRVDVLAEQRHLAVAAPGERPRLGDDVVERPAALGAAAERDDAVGARLVAAVDDRQPGVSGGFAADAIPVDGGGAGRGQAVGDADRGRWTTVRRAAPAAGPVPPIEACARRQAEPRRRAPAPGPDAGTGRPRGSVARALPGSLARRSSRSARRAAPGSRLQPREVAHAADHLLLGRLADRAGVDDDEVGRLEAGASAQPAARARRPSPPSRCGSSGSRASRRGSAAGPGRRAELGEALVVGVGGSRGRRSGRRGVGGARSSTGSARRGFGSASIIGGPTRCASRPSAVWRSRPTSRGTHRAACASAYDSRSPW